MSISKEKLKWRVFKHGDSVEIANWPFIKDNFPNYENFWSLFIAPSTGRDENPPHVHFKKGVTPLLEEMSMMHYTVFRCLSFINGEIKTPKHESLRNTYSHFALIAELVGALSNKIYCLKCEVGLAEVRSLDPLDKAGAVDKFKQFLEKDDGYDRQFKNLKASGRPIVYFVQSRPDYLEVIVNDKKVLKKAEKFFQKIKGYRNSFVHTALPDSLYLSDASGQTIGFAIKKECLGKYTVFTEIKHKFEQREIDDFIVQEHLIRGDLIEMQSILNEIWEFFIQEMNEVARQPKFKKLACLEYGSAEY
jgi:hypothetical protein